MAEPYYVTVADLRTELSVNSAVLPDADAIKVIQQAEDELDSLLGNWIIDVTTGRKIVQANVQTWQWAKLARAALLLSAEMYRDPARFNDAQFDAVSGPDFSFSGPRGGQRIPPRVLQVLNDSKLRRLTGQTTKRFYPQGYEQFFRTPNPSN